MPYSIFFPIIVGIADADNKFDGRKIMKGLKESEKFSILRG
jgi:hypothetical protein